MEGESIRNIFSIRGPIMESTNATHNDKQAEATRARLSALFNNLEACGLYGVNRGRISLQEMRFNHGLYNVYISQGRSMAEYIHITKPVALILAKFFKDPNVGDIDIPFVSAIDEDAKPILEEAIRQYRGLGAMFGYRTLNSRDDNSAALNWFNRVLAESDNPNLIGASRASNALLAKTQDNQHYVDSIIETIKKPEKIDRDVCEMAAERMPLLLCTMENHNERRERWQKSDDAKGILRLQAAAKGYGITLNVPAHLREAAKELAVSEEATHRSWTTLPTVERKGAIKRNLPASVLTNDGDRFHSNTPYDRKKVTEEGYFGTKVSQAHRAGIYPPENQR
jgi:hypothetical protein